MSQSMTVTGVLRARASRGKRRPGRKHKRLQQDALNAHRPHRRRKKSNAELIQEASL